MPGRFENPQQDLVSSFGTYAILWGIPTIAMIAAIFFLHPTKTLIWIAALLWMGSACLINARRCHRTHCYCTGRFFLAMNGPVFLHGFGVIALGDDGWKWLGFSIILGAGGLWYFSEKLSGKYQK